MAQATRYSAGSPVRIRFLMLGKTRRAEVRGLLEDYFARIGRFVEVEARELRDSSPAELRKLKLDPGATLVLVDPGGKQFTSDTFAQWLGGLRDRGAREIVFLCGDAEGFPETLRKSATTKLSLSSLTLSHELARAMLAEQIYRAFTILAGHPYSK